jgi:hypothetical protein
MLVGDDAQQIDDLVRRSPKQAYDVGFSSRALGEVGRRVGP